MPSRKRAKGRERKLKQQARERSVSQPPSNGENTNLPEQNIRRIEHEENVKFNHGRFKHQTVRGHQLPHFMDTEQNIPRIVEQAKRHNMKCLHGAVIPPRGHPVYDFINTFQEGMILENGHIKHVDAMYETFEKHEDVWKDSTLRKMAINIMSRIGTNLLLLKDYYIDCARHICEAIIFLEKYDGEVYFTSVLSKATEDVGYLLCAEERDFVRFYKKRIPCSCLDDLYSEIKKSQDRGSRCDHCRQTVKRKDLKTCSRCKSAQYCSKECQKLDWPSHKEECMKFADFHKRVNNVETTRRNENRVYD